VQGPLRQGHSGLAAIIGISDASVLTSVVDGVLLVIQHRRNPQSMVVRARRL